MGELLRHLQLPEETIRSLYFSDLDDILGEEEVEQTYSPAEEFDLFSDPAPVTTTTPQRIEKWKNHALRKPCSRRGSAIYAI